MRDKVFTDTNLFLYTFDKRDLFKHNIAKDIILYKTDVISVQVINEVSNNLLKKFKLKNFEVKNFIKSCYKRYEVINFNEDILVFACNLREDFNFSFYDSLIVATALKGECTYLYSEDFQHDQNIYNKLKIINPFKENI